jgi:hypothetical protein
LRKVIFVGNSGNFDKEDNGQLSSSSIATVDCTKSCVPRLACFERWGW